MSEAPWIATRGIGPVTLDGILATGLDELSERLSRLAGRAALVVSDLSLGAWYSHQVATDFFRQLSLTSEAAAPLRPPGVAYPSMADVIGTWIDVETQGDRSTLAGLRLATALARAVPQSGPTLFVVLVPRFGLPWERPDALFVRFASELLRGGPGRVVLASADPAPPALPRGLVARWSGGGRDSRPRPRGVGDLRLVPGVVHPGLDVFEGELVGRPGLWQFRPGYFLVAPEDRVAPAEIDRLDHDRLAARTGLGWLRAYAAYHGNNYYVEPTFLLEQGLRHVAEGGEGIGLRLLERALLCARSAAQRGLLMTQIQGLRVALQRFGEAAAAGAPPAGFPAGVRGILHQLEGWGALMAGDPRRGEAHLREAVALLEPLVRGTREHLYLLNIYALALFRTGDVQGAFAREHFIEQERLRRGIADSRLAYVNWINLARLYRHAERLETSAAYYDRAFATTLGVRSEGDGVYTNACLARVAAARGDAQEAMLGWLRACLHWLASAAPEALGPRVVTMLLGRPQAAESGLVQTVSEALLERLREAVAAAYGRPVPWAEGPGPDDPPTFTRLAGPRRAGGRAGVRGAAGAPGWGVLLGAGFVPPVVEGGAYRQLRHFLARLLAEQCPRAGIDQTPAVIVDDQGGREVPTALAELLGLCARERVPCIWYEGDERCLGAADLEGIERASRVEFSPAVEAVRQRAVLFRRALPERRLSEAEGQLLEAVDGADLGSLYERLGHLPPAEVIATVRGLEHDRVLVMRPPPECGGGREWRTRP